MKTNNAILVGASLLALVLAAGCSGGSDDEPPASDPGPGCDVNATDWTVWVTNQGKEVDTVTVLRDTGATGGGSKVATLRPMHGDEGVTAEILATIAVGRAPHNVAFSPDGKTAYVANLGTPPANGSISVIDTASYQVTATVETALKAHGVTVTPDGKEIWVANVASDNLTIIDAATLVADPNPIVVGDGPALVAFLPDGSKAYVSNGDEGSTSVVDVATRTVIKTIPTGKGAMGLVVSHDGRFVYETEGIDDRVSAIDTQSDTVVNVLPLATTGKEPHGIAGAGNQLLITNRTANALSFIDQKSLELIEGIAVPGRPDIISVSPNCDRAYMTLRDTPSVAVVDIHDRAYLDAIALKTGNANDELHGIAVLPGK